MNMEDLMNDRNVIKVGIHTPNRTTTFYNYLINQGIRCTR